MDVKLGRTKVELNDNEKDLLWAMYNFTEQYHDNTNGCDNLLCNNCPLALFCHAKGLGKEKIMSNIITAIENHANGEEQYERGYPLSFLLFERAANQRGGSNSPFVYIAQKIKPNFVNSAYCIVSQKVI